MTIRIPDDAKAIINAANALKSAYILCKEVSNSNQVNDPGWNNLQTNPSQSGGTVDETTKLISGTQATPANISDVIGSINNFLAYWEGTNFGCQDGFHLSSAWGQNIEKVAKAIV